MKIRVATKEDIDVIYRFLGEFKGTPVDHDNVQEQFLKYYVDTSDRAVILVEDEIGIHGMAVLSLIPRLGDVQCRIDYVYVHESARGKGYGRAIMNACDEWAWAHGANEVEFTSRPAREAANKLYQAAGYELYETNVYRRKRGVA